MADVTNGYFCVQSLKFSSDNWKFQGGLSRWSCRLPTPVPSKITNLLDVSDA